MQQPIYDQVKESLVQPDAEAFLVIDGDLRVRFVSPRLAERLHWQDAAGAHPPLDHVLRFENDLLECLLNACIGQAEATGRLVQTSDVRFRLRGEANDIAFRLIPVAGDDEPLCAVEVLDHTEASVRHGELQYLFPVLANHMSEAFVFFRDGRELTHANRAAEELLGKSAPALIGHAPGDLFASGSPAENERENPFVESILVGDALKEIPVEIAVNGTIRPVLASIHPLPADAAGIAGSLVVLRPTQTSNQELAHRLETLENQALIASGVAHDFNNLLMGLMGTVSLARRQLNQPDALDGLLRRAETATAKARALAQRMTSFGCANQTSQPCTDVASLVADTTALLLSGSRSVYRTVLGDDLPALHVSEAEFLQIFNNLVVNADQAMPTGGNIHIKVDRYAHSRKNHPRQLRRGTYLRLTVEDDGPGIPPSVLERIFDPFYTTKEGGSGLGLAMASGIALAKDGLLDVRTTVDAGTTFTLYLPAAPDPQPEASSEANCPAFELDDFRQRKGTGRILVMDDDDLVRGIAIDLLEFLGFSVTGACNGEEAVRHYTAAFRNGGFRACILDLTIPGEGGACDVLEKIRELDPSAVLILSTGYTNHEATRHPEHFGFTGCIPKPYSLEHLGTMLDQLLE